MKAKIGEGIIASLTKVEQEIDTLLTYYDQYRMSISAVKDFEKSKQISDEAYNAIKQLKPYKDQLREIKVGIGTLVGVEEIDEVSEQSTEEDGFETYDAMRDYRFTYPKKVKFLGEVKGYTTWTKAILGVCEQLILHNEQDFEKLVEATALKGRDKYYIGKENKYNDGKQLSNGLWIETCFSANDTIEKIITIVTECGYIASDIVFEVVTKKGEDKVNKTKQPETLSMENERVKLGEKYGSITLPKEVFIKLLKSIREKCIKKEVIVIRGLCEEVEEIIEQETTYGRTIHVVGNVIKLLADVGAISLYPGAKKGKYILRDMKSLEAVYQEPQLIS